MKQRLAMLSIAVCLTLLVSGCSSSATDGSSGTSSSSTTTSNPPSSTPSPSDNQSTSLESVVGDAGGTALVVNLSYPCPYQGDFESQFTEETMLEFVACVTPIADKWIDTVYKSMPHPSRYVFIPDGVLYAAGCAEKEGVPLNDRVFAYCQNDTTVYMGQAKTWELYQSGDAAVAYAIGHEITHGFQHQAGVFKYVVEQSGSPDENPLAYVPTENQADCGGGAFMNYLNRQGEVNVSDDIGDIDNVIPTLSNAESDLQRTHGTVSERFAGFNLGWTNTSAQPMYACNAYFPSVPLIG